MRVATIDIGTNSVLLLVADVMLLGRVMQMQRTQPAHERAAGEREERQEKRGGGERDREAEHDLNQPAETFPPVVFFLPA